MNPIDKSGRGGGAHRPMAGAEPAAEAGPSSRPGAPASMPLAHRSPSPAPSAPRQHIFRVDWAPGGQLRPSLVVGPPAATIEPAQQAIEDEVWASIHAGGAQVLHAETHEDRSMVVRLEVQPGGHQVALHERDGLVLSTRIAPRAGSPFEQLYVHGETGHVDEPSTGRGAPPTATPRSAEEEAAAAAIRSEVPAGDMSKAEHYEAIRAANGLRQPADRWSDRLMALASEASVAWVALIDERLRMGTEEEQEFRDLVERTIPPQLRSNGRDVYRWAKVQDHRLPEQQRLSEKGLLWVAGLNSSSAPRVAARTDQEFALLEHLLRTAPPARSRELAWSRYQRAVEYNAQLPDEEKLSDDTLKDIAELPRQKDSPRLLALRAFVAQGAPRGGREYKATGLKRALAWNDQREPALRLTDDRIAQGLKVPDLIAHRVLARHEEERSARAYLATHADPNEPAAARYRRLMDRNDEVGEAQGWSDEAMRSVAGVSSANAVRIRKRRNEDRAQAARAAPANRPPSTNPP